MILRRLFLIGLALFSSGARADSEPQSWVQVLSQGKLAQTLRVWVEAQPRYSFGVGGITTVLLRPAVGWQATPDLSLWGGYAWTPLVKPVSRDEHRAWTQAIHTTSALGGSLTQRLRLEGRFIEGASGTAFRLRYQARFTLPVALEGALHLALYDEIFLGLNTLRPVAAAGFDQNRLFLGAFHRFSPQLGLDAGYMCNMVRRPLLAENRTNHVAMISLYHWFDATGPDVP